MTDGIFWSAGPSRLPSQAGVLLSDSSRDAEGDGGDEDSHRVLHTGGRSAPELPWAHTKRQKEPLHPP